MVTHGVIGNYDAAAIAYDRAITLSPRDRSKLIWLAGKGIAAYIAGRYEEVLELAGAMTHENRNFASAHRQLAAANAMLGRLDEAGNAMKRVLELVPGLAIAQVRLMVPVQDPEAQERWLDGLRKAGLPE